MFQIIAMNDLPDREVEVFTEAIQLPVEQRSAFLEQACKGDLRLRRRVEELLQTHDQAGDFLEQSPQKAALDAKSGAAVGEKAGDRIGRYKLLQQIGEGGCGVVYMAEQEEPVRRRVALKIIKPGMDTKSVIARFESERQALALMDHPNIAKVFDAGATASGRPYFVMELVRGVSITEYCDQQSLTTAERLSLFVQVCKAVQHAHQKGIIHRDIKPSNILVTTTLEGAALPVVIDFGIAKATTNQRLTDKTLFTAFEMLIGTPAYMSPEQAALTSVDVDTRTDIYSLGVLLYELLTGLTPFDTGELLKSGLDEIRRVIREKEPVRPSTRLSKMTRADLTTAARYRNSEPPRLIRTIRGDLDWIVMKALEKDRTRRYESAYGMAQDVQRFLANETVSARPPGRIYKLQKTVLRNKLLFVGIGVITVFLLVSLIVVSKSLAQEKQARSEADVALRQAETDKAQAQAEAAKSRQVTLFLEDMLQGVGPSVARGRDTTMLQEILDRTAERVGDELTNQPAVESELRNLIGGLYLEIGYYSQAEQMDRTALEICRKLYGSESAQAATALDGLGTVFWKEGKLTDAEQAHAEALAIRRQLFGDNNADVAESMNALARIYNDQRRFTQAEPMIRQALEIRRRLYPGENLAVADSLHSLCLVLEAEGNWTEAETTAQELLAMRRRLLGNENVAVAEALEDLGLAAGFNGNLDVQEASYQEAFAIKHKVLGEEHPYVIKSIANLGEVMRLRGKLPEAHAVLKAVISVQSKVLGEDYPDTLSSLGSFAQVLEGEGNWVEAEAVNRYALALWQKRAGNEDQGTLWELRELVRDLVAQKKNGDAEQVLDAALTPAFISLPASADLLAARVELMGRQGRWQEAETNAILSVKYQPDDHYRQHTLAVLLVINHHRPEYEQLCGRILPQFADTKNPYVAERISGDCLLLPHSGVDFQAVDNLATKAVTIGKDDSAIGYFEACKALSDYRLGKLPEAVEWAGKSLNTSQAPARAKGFAVLAMAKWQLGEKAEARTVLLEGEGLAPQIPATNGTVDLGNSWLAWLCARISLDEAAALIQPGAASDDNSSKP
jgi:serine/threonine protein kinase/tetratricopeptide (TPR) repeat protein